MYNIYCINIAIENFGSVCDQLRSLLFVQVISQRLYKITGDVRETAFLFQRLPVIFNILIVFYLLLLSLTVFMF